MVRAIFLAVVLVGCGAPPETTVDFSASIQSALDNSCATPTNFQNYTTIMKAYLVGGNPASSADFTPCELDITDLVVTGTTGPCSRTIPTDRLYPLGIMYALDDDPGNQNKPLVELPLFAMLATYADPTGVTEGTSFLNVTFEVNASRSNFVTGIEDLQSTSNLCDATGQEAFFAGGDLNLIAWLECALTNQGKGLRQFANNSISAFHQGRDAQAGTNDNTNFKTMCDNQPLFP